MKTFFNLPTEKEFYDKYAPLISKLFFIGVLCQFFSAATEFGILYTMGYNAMLDIFPAIATGVGVFTGLVGMVFIEFGQRIFVPYAVRSVLYKRFAGLDLPMSLFILAITCGLLYFGGSFSFLNSYNIVDWITPEAEQEATEPVKQEQKEEGTAVFANFSSDSLLIIQGYQAQAEAKRSEYKSLIEARRSEIRKWYIRGKNENVSYSTRIRDLKTKIEELEAQRDSEIAQITANQGLELRERVREKNQALLSLDARYTAQVDSITAKNKQAVLATQTKVDRGGLGLGWFTILCLIVVVLSITLDEIHKKGSGIKINVIPSQYTFTTSILGDFAGAIANRLNYWIRSGIKWIENGTPPPPHPHIDRELYDYSELSQQKTKVKVRPKRRTGNIIYLDGTTGHDTDEDFEEGDQEKNRTGGKGTVRPCEHCGEEYQVNHKKQKYCSDSCRIQAWEKRKGRKLTKRKTK